MANWLNDYRVRPMESAKMMDRGEQFWREVYFDNMKKYVESQSHRGRPYIGEYLDETTGAWLMGDRELGVPEFLKKRLKKAPKAE